MDINTFKNELSPKEQVLLAKYLYKNENDTYSQDDIINDLDYEYYKSQIPTDCFEYTVPWDEVTYSDVSHLLDKMGLSHPSLDYKAEQVVPPQFEYLLNIWSKPRSIEMVEDKKIVYKKFQEMEDAYIQLGCSTLQNKYILMLKLDGWNVQLYYIPGHYHPVLVTTRGRGGNIVVCTRTLAHLMPPMNVSVPTLVSGELVLDDKILTHLKVKYNRPFKNSRNSVSSIIHGTIDVDSIKDHITIFAFDMQFEDGTRYNSRYETLAVLSSLGFNVPPHLLFDDTRWEYSEKFNNLQSYYIGTMSKSWKCDGLVCAPNYYQVNELIHNPNQIFQDGFMAIKMGTWSKKMYTGTVSDIICPPSVSGTYRELIAIVAPVETDDGRTVEAIPLKNLNRAKCGNDPVDVGDEIMFTYHSKQVVKFRGKNGVIYHN